MQSRVKVDAHVIQWRGLLLIYDCMVFGDTKESVDEVLVRAPFFCLLSSNGLLNKKLTSIFNLEIYEKNLSYAACTDRNIGRCNRQ